MRETETGTIAIASSLTLALRLSYIMGIQLDSSARHFCVFLSLACAAKTLSYLAFAPVAF